MIKLFFTTEEVIDPRFGSVLITVIRLMGRARFRRKDGTLSPGREVLIDMGAFLSVLPRYVWKKLQLNVIAADVFFGGINPRPECQIPASLGEVNGILVDEEGNFSSEFTFPAFLAKTDQVPIILGFAGLLDRVRVCFDYEGEEAYIEEKPL